MLETEFNKDEYTKVVHDDGVREGIEIGREEGMKQSFVETCKEFVTSLEETVERYVSKFDVSLDEAREDVGKYW